MDKQAAAANNSQSKSFQRRLDLRGWIIIAQILPHVPEACQEISPGLSQRQRIPGVRKKRVPLANFLPPLRCAQNKLKSAVPQFTSIRRNCVELPIELPGLLFVVGL